MPANDMYGLQVSIIKRAEDFLNPRYFYDLIQGFLLEFGNQAADFVSIAHAFYHHHELHGGFAKLHGLLSAFKLSAIDNVCPLNQIL
jgi:hypothetical protein